MSDSDGLDLAGVVGTWVAAFLAIVALVGILPVVLLYRQSKTKKAQALALLDDPSGNYVENTFRLANFRYQKIGKVTNLVGAPDLKTLEYNPEWKGQLQNESTSGWINLLYVINAAFPNRNSTAAGDDSNLLFQDGEIFLLVHRAWILVLAVLHCYAYRQDYGLPKENSSQDHINYLPWDSTLAGLSGGLFINPSASYDEDEGVRLTFIMHPRSTPTVLEGREDIGALVLLSFGFVKMTDGSHLRFTAGDRFVHRSRRHDTEEHHLSRGEMIDEEIYIPRLRSRIKIAQLRDHTTSSTESRLFSAMNLTVGKPKTIKAVEPAVVFQDVRTRWDEKNMGTKENYMKLGKFRPLGHDDDVWIHRRDAYRFSAGYLSTPVRRQGFLYPKKNDLLVSKLFSEKHTAMTLKWGQNWASQLDLKEDERKLLKLALGKLLNTDLENTSWSREAMQDLHELDQAILMACKSSDWKFRSVSVLFVCDKKFRARLVESLDCEDRHRQFVRFSIPNQRVELGRLEEVGDQHQAVFPFDFMSVFALDKPPSDSHSEGIPIAQAVFAALQGQIRVIMWKMSLNPRGMHEFTSNNLFYISTRPIRHVQVSSSSSSDDFDSSQNSAEASSSESFDSLAVSESSAEVSNHGIASTSQYGNRTDPQTANNAGPETSNNYRTVLHAASAQGDDAGVRRLIDEGFNKDAKDSDGCTALYWAAANGRLSIVKYLTSIGADLEACDPHNKAALSIAAERGHYRVVEFLLDKGVDSNIRDNSGSTALIWAAQCGQNAVVEVLLRHGTDKDAQNNQGCTALYQACIGRRWKLTQLLIDNGADCNIPTYAGSAPLHVAAAQGEKVTVQRLLEKGADIFRRDGRNKTALQHAVWCNHEAVCKLLEDWKGRIEMGLDAERCLDSNSQNPSIVQKTDEGESHDPS